MTVQDLRVTLEDFADDMPVRFVLEQRHINLQYDINDALVLTRERGGEPEEAVYLLGINENYGPKV